MDTKIILTNLSDKFGIRLDIREEKLPDKVKVIVYPQDFEKRKGFSIISEVKWLNLRTFLQFDSFSGDMLSSIMLYHKGKVDVMIDTLLMMTGSFKSAYLCGEIDGVKITDKSIPIDIRKMFLYIEDQTMKLNSKTVEEYIVDHQIIILGLVLLLFDLEEQYLTVYDEIECVSEGESEGFKTRVEVNKYERSRVNRQVCLNYHGYSCKVCGFNFEKTYGSIGKDYIHVHHIVPVSMVGEGYIINPILDLVPVCPNCHSIVHKFNPPIPISDLRSMLRK